MFIPGFSVGRQDEKFYEGAGWLRLLLFFLYHSIGYEAKVEAIRLPKLIKVANEVAQTEVKEVVLTGVNIGDFGVDTDESFYDLVESIG